MAVIGARMASKELERAFRVAGHADAFADSLAAREIGGTSGRGGATLGGQTARDLSRLEIWWKQLLFQAAPEARSLARAKIFASVGILALIAAMLVLRQPFLLLIAPLSPLLFFAWLRRRTFARAEAFEKDYPAFLLTLASSIRTGIDPLSAFLGARAFFATDSLLSKELAAAQTALERGATEDEAVRAFGASIAHPDVRLFQTAFLLARKEGSSLAVCLQRLVRVTRNRQSFRRKIRTAVAMQKLSSIGIAGCAVLIVLIQAVTNFDSLRTALHHPIGIKMLFGGATLMVLGLVWMMRMARARI